MTTTSSTTSTATTSNASLGQSILSSLNANGAGIDTNTLVTNLTAAQKASLEDPITTKQTANTAQISSAADIASNLSLFSSSVNTLISGGSLQTQPTSSNSAAMTVSTVSGTLSGAISASITVNKLAKAQTSQSNAYDSAATFKAGKIVLTPTTGTAVEVSITDNSSLSDVAKAINAQATGYSASVVNNTLVIKGATGAANGFSISSRTTTTTTDGDGNTTSSTNTTDGSLAALYTGNAGAVSGGESFTKPQAAQDAEIVMDGVTVTRASNTFSDVIKGVQMTLTGEGTTTIGSSRPTAAITQAVGDLVSAYNQLLAQLNTATAAASSSGDAGPLRGNTAIRQLKSQLAKITTTPLNASGSIRTLAELGVKTAQDGTLSLDSSTLSNMLAKYPDDVEAMFVTSQSSSSDKLTITSAAGTARSGTYTVTGIADTAANGTASGSINGVAMAASSWNLTAVAGNGADGLTLRVLSNAPTSATITINQGLGGVLSSLLSAMTATSGGKPVGALATLQSSLSTQKDTLADAMTKAEAQVTVYHDRLVKQFTQMNTLVSGYKATQSYLTQQVDLWTKSTS